MDMRARKVGGNNSQSNQNRTISWMTLFKNLELRESDGMEDLINNVIR